MTSSDYLVAHLREALAAHPDVGMLDLYLEVTDRSVHVSGVVDCESKRDAALALVRRMAAPREVVDNTKLLNLLPSEPPEVLHDPSGGHR